MAEVMQGKQKNAATTQKTPGNGLEVICCLESDGEYSFVYRLRSKLYENGTLKSTIRAIPILSRKKDIEISISWPEDREKGYDYTEKIEGKKITLPNRVWVGRNLSRSVAFGELFVLREGSNI